ncbi:MAG: hypothetical protein RL632_2089 [Bacteroidota bacterium]
MTCVPLHAFGQSNPILGARSISLGTSTVAITDVWTYQSNPGALADINKMTFSAAYQCRFLLKEMQSQGMVYAQPIPKGVLSAGFAMNGNSTLRVIRCGFGYSLTLFEKLSAGVQLNYQSTAIAENYRRSATFTAECGVLIRLTENCKIGASVSNIGRAKLASFQEERLPTKMRIGTSVQLSKSVLLSAEAEKELEHPLRFKVGAEYLPHRMVALRTGCLTNPIALSAGFGFLWTSFRLDFATQYHQVLGWTPQITFTYHGKKETK